jgi:hypothetical protein
MFSELSQTETEDKKEVKINTERLNGKETHFGQVKNILIGKQNSLRSLLLLFNNKTYSRSEDNGFKMNHFDRIKVSVCEIFTFFVNEIYTFQINHFKNSFKNDQEIGRNPNLKPSSVPYFLVDFETVGRLEKNTSKKPFCCYNFELLLKNSLSETLLFALYFAEQKTVQQHLTSLITLTYSLKHQLVKQSARVLVIDAELQDDFNRFS